MKLKVEKKTVVKLSKKEVREVEGGQDTRYRTDLIDKIKTLQA